MSESLSYQNATHLLKCRHAIGQSGRTYFMRCHVLKKMPDGRLKLQVYGKRYWRDQCDAIKTRYVNPDRVQKIAESGAIQ